MLVSKLLKARCFFGAWPAWPRHLRACVGCDRLDETALRPDVSASVHGACVGWTVRLAVVPRKPLRARRPHVARMPHVARVPHAPRHHSCAVFAPSCPRPLPHAAFVSLVHRLCAQPQPARRMRIHAFSLSRLHFRCFSLACTKRGFAIPFFNDLYHSLC